VITVMARIHVEDLHKTYPNGHVAARGIELEIADGELVVLVGASGCGKSTVLRSIAGLESPTRGRIWIGDRDVTRLRTQERDLAMVFQSYALYPHKRVRDNLAFGLEVRGVDGATIARRIAEVAGALGLEELLDRKPGQLSGGQRQRVALGRAIVREPAAFLLDEPLSNLDARLRARTRAELARLHRRLGATMVYVTHDQEEAMTLGDRIAVLDAGRVQQCAPPRELYRRPATAFVGGFVGSPAMNLLPGVVSRDGATLTASGAGWSVPVELGAAPPAADAPRDVVVGIRPQDLEPVAGDAADATGTVEVVELLGADAIAHVELAGAAEPLRLVTGPDALAVGDRIGLRFRRDRLHVFERGGAGRRLGPA
jgi:multiple sugar transport system ATP-binding protein